MLRLGMPKVVTWPRLVSRHKGLLLYGLVPVLLYSRRELELLPLRRSSASGAGRFPQESKVRLLCFSGHIVDEDPEA